MRKTGRKSVLSKLQTSGEKPCSKCNVIKPYSEFYYDKNHSTGHSCGCKECGRKACEKWRNENPDIFKRLNKEWRNKNTEFNKKRLKEWNLANPNKTKEYQAKAYKSDKNKILTRNRRWRSNNVEKVRAKKAEYSSRKRMAIGEFYPSDITNLMTMQNGECVFCKEDISKKYHIDHVVPLSKGGSNYKENLQLLCPTCNLRKRNSSQEEFANKIGVTL